MKTKNEVLISLILLTIFFFCQAHEETAYNSSSKSLRGEGRRKNMVKHDGLDQEMKESSGSLFARNEARMKLSRTALIHYSTKKAQNPSSGATTIESLKMHLYFNGGKDSINPFRKSQTEAKRFRQPLTSLNTTPRQAVYSSLRLESEMPLDTIPYSSYVVKKGKGALERKCQEQPIQRANQLKKTFFPLIHRVFALVIALGIIFLQFKRKMSYSILIFGLTLTSTVITVQAIPIIDLKPNGENGGVSVLKFFDVIASKTSGYIIAGVQTDSLLVQKFNDDGSEAFRYKSPCGGGSGFGIDYATDSGYIVVGKRNLACTGASGPTILNIGETGTVNWQTDFGVAGSAAYGIKALSTGNYAVVGYNSAGAGFLTKVSSAGTVLSTANPCTTTCFLRDVTEVSNKDIGISGYRTDSTPPSCYFGLVPYSGASTVERLFGYPGFTSRCNGVLGMADGTFVLSGGTNGGATFNHGDFDLWLMRIDSSGTKAWEKLLGGTGPEEGYRVKLMPNGNIATVSTKVDSTTNYLWAYVAFPNGDYAFETTQQANPSFFIGVGAGGISATSDNGLVVAGYYEVSATPNTDLDGRIFTVFPTCSVGYYISGTTCVACSPGTVSPNILSTNCAPCSIGTFANASAMTSCTPCSVGSVAGNGASSCTACANDWYPTVMKDSCLYKGIFASEANFNATNFAKYCFVNGIISKPYSEACRDGYHEFCCQGSSYIPGGISCTNALAYESNGTMDNYCSACPFMNKTTCPTDGVCWTDSTWSNNAVSPYPSRFTADCISQIIGYCGPKLQISNNDPECSIFSRNCVANISSIEYGSNKDVFRLTFSTDIQALPTNCTNVFSSYGTTISMQGIVCTVVNSVSVDVNVGALSDALSSFYLMKNAINDTCGFVMPTTIVWKAKAPTVAFQTIQIVSNVTNKCSGYNFKVTITVLILINGIETIQMEYSWHSLERVIS